MHISKLFSYVNPSSSQSTQQQQQQQQQHEDLFFFLNKKMHDVHVYTNIKHNLLKS